MLLSFLVDIIFSQVSKRNLTLHRLQAHKQTHTHGIKLHVPPPAATEVLRSASLFRTSGVAELFFLLKLALIDPPVQQKGERLAAGFDSN